MLQVTLCALKVVLTLLGEELKAVRCGAVASHGVMAGWSTPELSFRAILNEAAGFLLFAGEYAGLPNLARRAGSFDPARRKRKTGKESKARYSRIASASDAFAVHGAQDPLLG
jgi:hypothetical protein